MITFLSETTARVELPTLPVDSPDDWDISVDGLGATVTVVDVADIVGSVDEITLIVHPRFTPGADYTFFCDGFTETETCPDELQPEESSEWNHGVLDSLIQAIAETVADDVNNRPRTILLKAIAQSDDKIIVESTFGFPYAGKGFVNELGFTYTERRDGSLHGITWDDPFMGTPLPAIVTSGFCRIQTDLAFSDTTILRSDSPDSVAKILGLPRPYRFHPHGWRRAVWAMGYGYRGTPGASVHFLIGALEQFARVLTVSRAPANPTRLTAVVGTFVQSDVGKLARIGGRTVYRDTEVTVLGGSIYKIIGPETVSTYVELCPISTGDWTGADWDEEDEAECEILAFHPTEMQSGPMLSISGQVIDSTVAEECLYWVSAFVPSTLPPHYIQADASARPANQPDGGHILEDHLQDGNQVTGPFPWYLFNGGATIPQIESILDSTLPCGIRSLIEAQNA